MKAHFGSILRRFESDMRVTVVALESYFRDHQSYPPMRPMEPVHPRYIEQFARSGGADLMMIEPGSEALDGLTTPVAYSTSLFQDFYGRPFAYYNDRNLGWMLWWSGPDGVYDIKNPALFYNATKPMPGPELIRITYDPTNGVESSGDLWLIHKDGKDPKPTRSPE